MTCEEFERTGWDAEHDASLSGEARSAALGHVARCPRCAALEESWRLAKSELRLLAASTETVEVPARVEMRLRLEFRTRHRSTKLRRAAAAASWALAAAAVLVVVVSWVNWRHAVGGKPVTAHWQPAPANDSSQGGEETSTLIADGRAADFTPLPGSNLSDTESASVVRVRMQRSSLGALGLPVAEDAANDWIQVDLLISDDGLPQAVRVEN
jgi:hypothetical protein